MNNQKLKFGGMIAENYDNKLFKKKKLSKNELAFSHGRSAMIWLVRNNNYKNCLICNYTWPAIPDLMKKLKLNVSFYDLFQKSLDEEINMLNGKTLIIMPIFYGFKPWIDYKKLANKFNDKVYILIDGAQTAYAHNQYTLPVNGAILSCPHKSVGVNDGAILKLSNLTNQNI